MASQLNKRNTFNFQFTLCIVVFSLLFFQPNIVLSQAAPPSGPPMDNANSNPSVPANSPNGTITFGGKLVPLLDNSFCETHRRGRNFTEFTLVSQLQNNGFNLGSLSGACELKIQSEKYRDEIKGVTEKFNTEDSTKSKDIMVGSIKNTFTQLGWKQNLFFFQINCSGQSVCFRRGIQDDTDPDFNKWVEVLDAKVSSFLKTLPPPKFFPHKNASGNKENMTERYTLLKEAYLNDKTDEHVSTEYVNMLIMGDRFMELKKT